MHTPYTSLLGEGVGGGGKEGRKEGTQWVHRIHHANIQGCPPPRCSYKDSQPFGRMRWTETRREWNPTTPPNPRTRYQSNSKELTPKEPKNTSSNKPLPFCPHPTALADSGTCALRSALPTRDRPAAPPSVTSSSTNKLFYYQSLIITSIYVKPPSHMNLNHLYTCSQPSTCT